MAGKCFCHFNGYEVKDAAARTHMGNKENPHNVTAAQVGAAPAGYADNGHDTVIAQGTSSAWKYRKWASGIAECWMSNHNFDNLSVSANSTQKTSFAYPFTFANADLIQNISITTANVSHNLTAYSTTKYAHYGEMCVHNSTENAVSGFTVDVYVIGRWQ